MSVSGLTPSTTYYYRVRATNSGGTSGNSGTISVTTLGVAPSITSQPSSQAVTVGQSVTFSASASGTPPLSFRWFKDGSQITGATASSYTISSVQRADAGTYTVAVSNSTGTVTSNGATLTVNVAAPGTPTANSANSITSSSFQANWSSATGATSYYIDVATNSGFTSFVSGYNNCSAGSGLSMSVSGLTPSTTYYYRVRATNSGGTSGNSGMISVTTTTAGPNLNSEPISLTRAVGQAASFSVTASGVGTLTYQWYKDGSSITGATSGAYAIAAVQMSDAGSYSVDVTDTTGTTHSTAATLTVTAPPVIVSQPASLNVTAGQSASFSVIASGATPLNIQWNKDGVAISGATASTYSIQTVKTEDAGSYTVSVSNAFGSVTSSAATLTVGQSQPNAPVVTITAPAQMALFTFPATIAISAAATSSSNSITKVDFYDGSRLIGTSTASPYGISWSPSLPGTAVLTAVATDATGATGTSPQLAIKVLPSIPYSTDFESGEGYTLNHLDGQLAWTVPRGSASVTQSAAASGTQKVTLSPSTPATTITQMFGAPTTTQSILFVDAYAQPFAGTDSATGSVLTVETGIARLYFFKNGDYGQFYAENGSSGTGVWQAIARYAPLDGTNIANTWQRITIRVDFTNRIYDVYLNGALAAYNIGFSDPTAGSVTTIGSISFSGATGSTVQFDHVNIPTSCPLFPDVNNDGIDDNWETAHGLSLSVNQRMLDPDGDGSPNIQEWMLGTDPQTASLLPPPSVPLSQDSDGDGIPDWWETKYGLNPLNPSDAATVDSNGMTYLQEYKAGLAPTSAAKAATLPAPYDLILATPTGGYLGLQISNWTISTAPSP